jgi:CDP-diacylglycerol---serine O-phosphatidyltransferase
MTNKLKLFTLPNIVTIANLACGFVGIQQVFEGNLQYASYCIYLAAFFDFLDGFVARLFKTTSELGKQLDSLCDVVSFGVLPGFMVYTLLVEYKWIAMIIPLYSALRLAKFNVDERQSESFRGVPTPMNALFVSSLTFILNGNIISSEINWILIVLVVFSTLMLVVEMPLIALKFNSFAFRENIYKYLILFLSLVFVVLLKWDSFVFIYFTYLFFSFLQNIKPKLSK